jgi:serine/threonine protein kinase
VLKVLNINGVASTCCSALCRSDIISQARHPSVATIYGHGQTDSHAYIVMEYFAGGDAERTYGRCRPDWL